MGEIKQQKYISWMISRRKSQCYNGISRRKSQCYKQRCSRGSAPGVRAIKGSEFGEGE